MPTKYASFDSCVVMVSTVLSQLRSIMIGFDMGVIYRSMVALQFD